jgi:hypothetical protein
VGIRITDLRIQIRIRILFFSSVADKMQQKISFFVSKFFCLLLYEGTCTMYIVHQSSKIKNQKRSKKVVEIKVFLTFLLVNERMWIRTNNAGSGIWSQIKEAQKHKDPRIQIRIHNTGWCRLA